MLLIRFDQPQFEKAFIHICVHSGSVTSSCSRSISSNEEPIKRCKNSSKLVNEIKRCHIQLMSDILTSVEMFLLLIWDKQRSVSRCLGIKRGSSSNHHFVPKIWVNIGINALIFSRLPKLLVAAPRPSNFVEICFNVNFSSELLSWSC